MGNIINKNINDEIQLIIYDLNITEYSLFSLTNIILMILNMKSQNSIFCLQGINDKQFFTELTNQLNNIYDYKNLIYDDKSGLIITSNYEILDTRIIKYNSDYNGLLYVNLNVNNSLFSLYNVFLNNIDLLDNLINSIESNISYISQNIINITKTNIHIVVGKIYGDIENINENKLLNNMKLDNKQIQIIDILKLLNLTETNNNYILLYFTKKNKLFDLKKENIYTSLLKQNNIKIINCELISNLSSLDYYPIKLTFSLTN